MGIMQAPGDPKKKLLTPKRVNEIADSLEKSAYSSLRVASDLGKKAKTETEKRTADYMSNSGMSDLRNSERYRKLAEAKKKSN